MKIEMCAFIFLLMAALVFPVMTAARSSSGDNVMVLNMSLENETPVEPCVLSGQCAIGHVYVNVTEPPPQPGITGMLTAFDYGSLIEGIYSFFSSLFS